MVNSTPERLQLFFRCAVLTREDHKGNEIAKSSAQTQTGARMVLAPVLIFGFKPAGRGKATLPLPMR